MSLVYSSIFILQWETDSQVSTLTNHFQVKPESNSICISLQLGFNTCNTFNTWDTSPVHRPIKTKNRRRITVYRTSRLNHGHKGTELQTIRLAELCLICLAGPRLDQENRVRTGDNRNDDMYLYLLPCLLSAWLNLWLTKHFG